MKLNYINDIRILKLKKIKSNNAQLYVMEDLNKIMIIKRTFTIVLKNLDKKKRGGHAHKIDNQIITCPFGSINFYVDDGSKRKKILINNPMKIVYVPKHIWTETEYLSKETVVSCYSSSNYDERSYIRNYENFLKFRKI